MQGPLRARSVLHLQVDEVPALVDEVGEHEPSLELYVVYWAEDRTDHLTASRAKGDHVAASANHLHVVVYPSHSHRLWIGPAKLGYATIGVKAVQPPIAIEHGEIPIRVFGNGTDQQLCRRG